MKKLINKIAVLFLGMIVAVGVGVAVGNTSHAIPVKAATIGTHLRQVTSLTSGNQYVIVGNNNGYALPTNPTVSSGKVAGKAIANVPNNGSGYLWTFTQSGSYWLIGDGTKYIYHANGGNSGTNLAYGTLQASYPWNLTYSTSGQAHWTFAGVVASTSTVKSRGMLCNSTNFGGYALNNESSYKYMNIYEVVREYVSPVTNLDSLWDGQKVYISDGSEAAFLQYSSGNSIPSVKEYISDEGLDVFSTTACQYRVHRMKIDSTTYYLFSFEESGTTYYIKDVGTASEDAITKVADISDAAIYWTLSVGAKSGQWVITNRSNTSKPNLQINPNNGDPLLSCYDGGQTNPYLYAVSSYSESTVAAGFAAGAMYMSENNSGQCVGYYPIAKQVWNAMSEYERLYVDEEQPLAYARLVDWAAYHNETINNDYDIVSANRISVSDPILLESENNILFVIVISMISITFIGGYIFIRRRKRNH